MRNLKSISKKKTNLKAILIGICLTLILHLALSLPAAAIINATKNPLAAIGLAGIFTHVICGAVTGFAVSKYKPDGAVISCLFASLSFLPVSLAVGIIAGEGGIRLGGLINSAIYVAVCTLGAVIFKRLGKRR